MLRSCHLRLASALALLVMVSACSKNPTSPTETPDSGAPVITAQPQDQSVRAGSSATLNVAASGPATIQFQWYRGASGDVAVPVSGATSASYTTPALTSTARFWVRVTAGDRAVDSTTATVAVDAVAPSIFEQPESESISPGRTVELFVEVHGTGPFSFQWYQGRSGSTANPIDGATGDRLTVAPTSTTEFWVRVSSPAGSVDSATATITVSTAPAPAPPTPPSPTPPAPTPPTPSPDPTAVAFENEVLVLINQRRAAGATCDGTVYPAAPALSMNGNLRTAARGHSQDMATRNYFSHTTPEGRTFMQRISASGFSGSGPFAENIGAGYGSPAAVVNGWMNSAGHCQHLMGPGFRQAGVGYAYGSTSYWTLKLAGN